MIHPEREISYAFAVRDGHGGPTTCAACGCRLEDSQDGAMFRHFNPLGGRDARGCRVACADLAHDSTGHVLVD
jgi:hypothetical protein